MPVVSIPGTWLAIYCLRHKSPNAERGAVAQAAEGNRHVTMRSAAMKIASLAKSGMLDWDSARPDWEDAARQGEQPPGETSDLLNFALEGLIPGNPSAKSMSATTASLTWSACSQIVIY